jgi:hypothetical protein
MPPRDAPHPLVIIGGGILTVAVFVSLFNRIGDDNQYKRQAAEQRKTAAAAEAPKPPPERQRPISLDSEASIDPPFVDELNAAIRNGSLRVTDLPERGGKAYVKGKVVVVRQERDARPEYDSFLTVSLPNDLQAGTFDEVGTIAVVRKRQEQVGRYTGAGGEVAAVVDVYHLTLVDRKAGAVIVEKTFRGEEPPQAIEMSLRADGRPVSKTTGGADPSRAMMHYLASLPRR